MTGIYVVHLLFDWAYYRHLMEGKSLSTLKIFWRSTLVEENTLILCHSFNFSLTQNSPNLQLWPSLVKMEGWGGLCFYLRAELQSKNRVYDSCFECANVCVCVSMKESGIKIRTEREKGSTIRMARWHQDSERYFCTSCVLCFVTFVTCILCDKLVS